MSLIVGLSLKGLGSKSAPSDHSKGGKLKLCTVVKKPDEMVKHGKTRHTASTTPPPTTLSPCNTFFPHDPKHKGNVFAREFNKAGKSVKA